MELTHLRYFQAVAQIGSMTGASRELRVSQPTLTVAIQKLEEYLNTTLFLRDRRGVQLTSTGHELLHHVGEVFRLLEGAEQKIRGLETEDAGRFVLGVPESLGAYFLPDFMAHFLVAAPQIQLTLWNGTSPDVHSAVVNRNVHVGLIVNPMPHPDLVLVPLFPDATDFFVGAQLGAAKSVEKAHQVLREQPLIYLPRLPQSQELLGRLSVAGCLSQSRLEVGNLELVKQLVIGGVGVGILPRRVAAYGRSEALMRLHPSLPSVPDQIHLVYRGDMHRTRAAMRLKDALVVHGKRQGAVE